MLSYIRLDNITHLRDRDQWGMGLFLFSSAFALESNGLPETICCSADEVDGNKTDTRPQELYCIYSIVINN